MSVSALPKIFHTKPNKSNKMLTTITSQKGLKIEICEAVGCEAEATHDLEVSVGKFGSIPLSLCNNCIMKFR